MPVTSAALYEKAKQRMLNRLGKKTSLTRNQRVDFITPRLEQISQTRRRIATLIDTFRTNYRKTLWAGTELSVQLMAIWSSEMGSRTYNQDANVYLIHKNDHEKSIVQDASDALRSVMEDVEKLSVRFDKYLRKEASAPFGKNSPDEAQLLARLTQAKSNYKAVRTRYSDATINFKNGSASAQELDTTRTEFEAATRDLSAIMNEYELNWSTAICEGLSTFFKMQQEYMDQMAYTLSELETWTAEMSLDHEQMRTNVENQRTMKQLSSNLGIRNNRRIEKTASAPIISNISSQDNINIDGNDAPQHISTVSVADSGSISDSNTGDSDNCADVSTPPQRLRRFASSNGPLVHKEHIAKQQQQIMRNSSSLRSLVRIETVVIEPGT